MAYEVENAIFQWEEGERRLREADPRERARLEPVVADLVDELRRRLGSEFTVQELSDLYASEPDLTGSALPAWVADAAYSRYASQSSDYGGGRRRRSFSRG